MTFVQRVLVAAVAAALSLPATLVAAAPGPGDVPPSDIGVDLEGDRVLLDAYLGKAVIVTFWATWCPYCLKELPVLENVQNKVGKEQMAVIAVNTEDAKVFRKAARALGGSLHMALVSDASGRAREAFGVRTLPHMLIIGRDGRILKVYHGYSEEKLPDIVEDINKALLLPP